jgi:hypothetical protein
MNSLNHCISNLIKFPHLAKGVKKTVHFDRYSGLEDDFKELSTIFYKLWVPPADGSEDQEAEDGHSGALTADDDWIKDVPVTSYDTLTEEEQRTLCVELQDILTRIHTKSEKLYKEFKRVEKLFTNKTATIKMGGNSAMTDDER